MNDSDTKPADPNEYDSEFWTPLMHAVEDGDSERFEALIAAGADVNMGDMEAEQYPVTIAVENGREELFFRLVEHGAKLDVWEYCCPCCDMWYGFNLADLFVYAMESDSLRIARYLRFLGVRPWSRSKSMDHGSRTVRESGKNRGKDDFLRAVFTPAELSSKKEERNIYEWLGWDGILLCRDVHATHDSGYWPVAVRMPDESRVSNYGSRTEPTKTVRIYTAKAYYAVRIWEEARKRCIGKGLDADADAVWIDAFPSHRIVRYGTNSWDDWDKYVSAMYDELARIADSGTVSVHPGRNVPPPGTDAEGAKRLDYVIPDETDKRKFGWTEKELESLPTAGESVSLLWKDVCHCFVRLTGEHVAFLHAERMARFSDRDEALFKACSNLDIRAMASAIAAGANVFATKQSGATAAHEIANEVMSAEFDENPETKADDLARGRLAFQCLLDQGGDLDFAGYGECCPIDEAGHGFPELAKMLLDLGADPNAPSWFEPDEWMRTAIAHVNLDYSVYGDENGSLARVERLLYRAGGMHYGIWELDDREDNDDLASEDAPDAPNETFPEAMTPRDRKLVQAVRRGWEYNATLAVRWGGAPAVRDERGRSLVRIFAEDYETYRPKSGGLSPYSVTNFVLFLLKGLRVPVDDTEMAFVREACRKNGYAEVLEELDELVRS